MARHRACFSTAATGLFRRTGSRAPSSLPREPVYYIERSEEELRSSSMWYYCESEAAYYPYVSQCPAGWVQVEPFALP